MIREVYENRHPDGGVPELVCYAECDDCGKDITHDHCYFVGDAKHGKECYCDECAVSNGWVDCFVCKKIIEEKNTVAVTLLSGCTVRVCFSCL